MSRTNAHLLIQVLHEHHVRKMNYSTNEVILLSWHNQISPTTQTSRPFPRLFPDVGHFPKPFPDLSRIPWHFQVSRNSRLRWQPWSRLPAWTPRVVIMQPS